MESAIKKWPSYAKTKKQFGWNIEALSGTGRLLCHERGNKWTISIKSPDRNTEMLEQLVWSSKRKWNSGPVSICSEQKKWIDSLIALTTYINIGKLKEWNNKTKVSKRLAYGYRNEEYFFTLIKYLTIPS